MVVPPHTIISHCLIGLITPQSYHHQSRQNLLLDAKLYLGEKFGKIAGAVGEAVGDTGLLEHGSKHVCKRCVFSVFEVLAMLEAKATSTSKHEWIIFVRVRGAVAATINNGGLIEQSCITLRSVRRLAHAIKEGGELLR